jgi:3',5'-cyclic AMP phosphodiesterase CpdA
MKLYAISDLHLSHDINRQALDAISPHPEDWLILAGDVGEKEEQLQYTLSLLSRRFKQLVWVPGNHDLWTLPGEQGGPRGQAKYERLVALCRDFGVLTPEDPYALWQADGQTYHIAPLFTLYDYSFRPADIPLERAVEWAAEANTVCSDEYLLYPDPYPTRSDWCMARCDYTEQRLEELSPDIPLILVNHFPLREDLLRLRRIPRFSLWCGTRRTADWHIRFPVAAVVYGHLHVRGSHRRDGVRFEEVSLGYPRDWDYNNHNIETYMRQILPITGEAG